MTDASSLSTDVAIIGAGPTGLFAAFECGMLKLNCVLLDALDEVGGQCAALYPEKPIYDIPAHPAIEGAALVEALDRQIAPFDVPRLLGRRVERLTGHRGDFVLGTDRGDTIRARAVIVAAGAGAFGPNRPPLAGLEGFEATGAVQYYVRRRADFAGTRIVIAGGGDSAIDWALSLKDVAEKIWLVHRRDRFRAAPESLRQLDEAVAAGLIEKIVPYQLHGLHGAAGALEGVEVATLDGDTRILPGNRLLPFFGLSTDLGPIAHWGMDSVRSTIPVVPSTCETSLPGVFAVGDVATYPGKLKLILQGFSEGAMAAHAIHPIVRPDTALHFEYSTSKGVPDRA
ncbi:NAD(P)/FAD-dependent oxidoreductase [Gluconacetobacter azotocaptans]|uniref:Ferredoxin--NADP reductase n=1 Tax=Gluconacetobacter azotocaptans TaxID=142834 RepID=A0A7W4JT15_9PROT|nr:NAD(P)/FAD-dependent oxidoreductase [Gluconacetobacter azotocaptans]MBB2190369.1 NAD(P)/FAD-dependent oxidoreductase [Gluconacetobacter azotocaptans]MBM9400594.1 NAD(P)/FAD-dependent oxidoreductase [Gluconacetobacter azotocaptans]GBQ28735.1 thioredoxin reductase [Gluconacetobacter azotocaptans DSM 13594]